MARPNFNLAGAWIAQDERAAFEAFAVACRLGRRDRCSRLGATGEKQEQEDRPHPASLAGSGGCVDSQFAQLTIERGAANSEAARNLGHPAPIMADCEADNVGLDFLEGAKVAVLAV